MAFRCFSQAVAFTEAVPSTLSSSSAKPTSSSISAAETCRGPSLTSAGSGSIVRLLLAISVTLGSLQSRVLMTVEGALCHGAPVVLEAPHWGIRQELRGQKARLDRTHSATQMKHM